MFKSASRPITTSGGWSMDSQAQGPAGGWAVNRPHLRVALVLVLAFAFGALASLAKSSGLASGALLGLLATMIALTGFYFVGTLLQDLGGHGFFRDLQLELSANKGYLEGGLVTGPLFGALGVWWRRTRTLRASVVAGALLMAEPLVLLAVGAYGGGVLPRTHGLPEFVRIVPGW